MNEELQNQINQNGTSTKPLSISTNPTIPTNLNDLYNSQNNLMNESLEQQNKIIDMNMQNQITEIERQREVQQAEEDKIKKALSVEYQQKVKPTGVLAEQQAENGLAGSGYAESSKVNLYNNYQNQRTSAMNEFTKLYGNYDAQITEARANGDIQKAQALFNGYQTQMSSLMEMYGLAKQQEQFDYTKQQDTLNRDFQNTQFDYQKERDKILDNRYLSEMERQAKLDKLEEERWQKEYALSVKALKKSSSGSGSSGYISDSSALSSSSSGLSEKGQKLLDAYMTASQDKNLSELLNNSNTAKYFINTNYKNGNLTSNDVKILMDMA